MNIGHMDRRIELQTSTESVNTYGERADSWATFATVWAAIVYKGGSEKVSGDQVSATNKVEFRIRYSSTTNRVLASDRVLYNSQYYQILAVEEIGRREGLTLICELRDA